MEPLSFKEYDSLTNSVLFKNKEYLYFYITLTENNIIINCSERYNYYGNKRLDKNHSILKELEEMGALVPFTESREGYKNKHPVGQVYFFKNKYFDLDIFGIFQINNAIIKLTNSTIEEFFNKVEIYETFS